MLAVNCEAIVLFRPKTLLISSAGQYTRIISRSSTRITARSGPRQECERTHSAFLLPLGAHTSRCDVNQRPDSAPPLHPRLSSETEPSMPTSVDVVSHRKLTHVPR